MKSKKIAKPPILPRLELGRRNILIFSIGILFTIAGFSLMTIGPWDNPLSRTWAPILLVIAFVIFFPWAIMAGWKSNRDKAVTAVEPEESSPPVGGKKEPVSKSDSYKRR